MDNGICDGCGARTCARYETLSTAAGHIFGQCAAHTVGLSHVRNNWNIAVSDLGQRFDRAQASAGVVAALLRIERYGVSVAMRHHVDNIAECAGHAFAMQTRRLSSGRYKVSDCWRVHVKSQMVSLATKLNNPNVEIFLQSNRRRGGGFACIARIHHMEWTGHVDSGCTNMWRLYVQRAYGRIDDYEFLHHGM